MRKQRTPVREGDFTRRLREFVEAGERVARRPSRRIRILLVDGQEMFRTCIGAVLEGSREVKVVGEAARASEVAAAVAKGKPDVVVADLSLADGAGGQVLEELRLKCPGVPVVVLTASTEEAALTKALTEGARGYVLKDTPPALVLHAIRAVHTGETWVQREMVGQLTGQLKRIRVLSRGKGIPGGLSERQLEVLKLLAAGESTSQIAKQLFVGQSTVRVHIMRILEKLGAKNRVQVVCRAIKEGLIEL